MINQIKTVLLLAGLSGLLMFIGATVGGKSGLQGALILSIIINLFAYFFSDKIVLNMYRAKPLPREHYASIYEMVDELARSMKLPMPKLWLIPNQMANAFATGRNPSHASIGLTNGILNLLDERELRAVLAHELSHVKNRDILVSSVAATLASAIGYMANIAFYAGRWGRNDRQGTGPLMTLLISLLMPIAATLIQLGISRSREYMADETGANACKDPLALADALEKLHQSIANAHLDKFNAAQVTTASMFIVYPFTGGGWTALFSTHPPMQLRIKRLREIAHKNF